MIAGGALTAEINLMESDSIQVESVYTFASRQSLQEYFDGPAIPLRDDGKKKFIDTGKVSFTRRIGEILFTLSS